MDYQETPRPQLQPERVAHYKQSLKGFLSPTLRENDLEGFSLDSVNAQAAAAELLNLSHSRNEIATLVTKVGGDRIAISLFTKTPQEDTFLVQTIFCQRNPDGFLEESESPKITLSRYGAKKLRELKDELKFKPTE